MAEVPILIKILNGRCWLHVERPKFMFVAEIRDASRICQPMLDSEL